MSSEEGTSARSIRTTTGTATGRTDRPRTAPVGAADPGRTEGLRERARYMARRICRGFVAHDDRDWEGAVEAFYEVDRRQFAHLDDAEAHAAARAYAAALWEKDRVEDPHVRGGELDRRALAAADWSPVEARLARRAEVVGADREYATRTTEAWRKHKVGGDYWTPTMAAQRHEIAAALGGAGHPKKPTFGRSGFGHLASYYLVGTELHDMHTRRHWERAAEIMTHYYEEVLARRAAAAVEPTA
ncbi:hypothetical protein [Halegenticoccus soli]|uniref:hypothetical protein n=1 Tax=Halegenticoccus soli TaxID=1985678 RepID=UPI000C6EF7BA|nr:hypothetical protein [Halegenticoccus soli]